MGGMGRLGKKRWFHMSYQGYPLPLETGAAHRRRQTGHNNPYRPNMEISLGTDADGVENEHTVRGGADVKGNIKIQHVAG
jgi:hypothetical protein